MDHHEAAVCMMLYSHINKQQKNLQGNHTPFCSLSLSLSFCHSLFFCFSLSFPSLSLSFPLFLFPPIISSSLSLSLSLSLLLTFFSLYQTAILLWKVGARH